MAQEPQNSAPRRIEGYLDQILAPLTRRLSVFHQDELRRELRAHLWGRVEAYRELGHPEEEAVTEALRQFGGAEDFLREWRREWKRTSPGVTLRIAYQSGRQVILPLLAGLVCADLIWGVVNGLCYSLYEWRGMMISPAGTVIGWAFSSIVFLLLPILLGVQRGRQAPDQAGMDVFAAIGALIAAGSTLYLLGTVIGLDQTAAGNALASQVVIAAAWLPVTCMSAALSGWWTRRTKVRRGSMA